MMHFSEELKDAMDTIVWNEAGDDWSFAPGTPQHVIDEWERKLKTIEEAEAEGIHIT